jgi:hypothetical protein
MRGQLAFARRKQTQPDAPGQAHLTLTAASLRGDSAV